MKITKILLYSFGAAALLTACHDSNDDDPTGSWKSASPISVADRVDGATAVTKSFTIDFSAAAEKNVPGEVTLTADYDVTVPFVTDSVTNKTSYQATATVKGTWTKEAKSDDDYLLTFDTNTLSVTGIDAPMLGPVTNEFLSSLAAFTSIEDVDVSDDGTHMTFETDHPDVKYHFVKK